MLSFSSRSGSEVPGWFEDPTGDYEQRWMGEDERFTGYVQMKFWDPAYGPNPDAEFWLTGLTGVIGLVNGQIVIVTHAGSRRGASRLTFPVNACFLVFDEFDVRLRVRVELGTEESPTRAYGEVTLYFRPEQACALRGLIAELQPDCGLSPVPVELDEEQEREPVAHLVEPDPVEESPLLRVASEHPVQPRLHVLTAPEGDDWICFRPMPSSAQIISPMSGDNA